jgi:hypothetical protein
MERERETERGSQSYNRLVGLLLKGMTNEGVGFSLFLAASFFGGGKKTQGPFLTDPLW